MIYHLHKDTVERKSAIDNYIRTMGTNWTVQVNWDMWSPRKEPYFVAKFNVKKNIMLMELMRNLPFEYIECVQAVNNIIQTVAKGQPDK